MYTRYLGLIFWSFGIFNSTRRSLTGKPTFLNISRHHFRPAMKMSMKDWFSVFGSQRTGRVNVTCNRCGKKLVGQRVRCAKCGAAFCIECYREEGGEGCIRCGGPIED
jgi:hypothetical protein